jgi:hypothetical protein
MAVRRGYSRRLSLKGRKNKAYEAMFETEAGSRYSWHVHKRCTDDEGTDYIIERGWAKLQIQLRSACIDEEGTYGIHLSKFYRDPCSFFVFLIVHAKLNSESEFKNAFLRGWPPAHDFYIIPTTDMTKKLEPWKRAFETDTWKTSRLYKSNLSLRQVEEFWKKFKNIDGWRKLKELTHKSVLGATFRTITT